MHLSKPSARRTHRAALVLAAGLSVSSLGLSGCGVISAVKKAVKTVEQNKATMDAFTAKIKAGEATTFEATYVTTGSAPATVVYAVEPPAGVLFTLTQTATSQNQGNGGSDNTYLVANPTGEYGCTKPLTTSSTSSPTTSSTSSPTTSSQWQCDKLQKTSEADYNNILDFYTPAHWVTFLNDFALAAGFAGDTVTRSTSSINGFALSCVGFGNDNGTSKICTTQQNILGLVDVAGTSTKFEITKYSSTPAASLFQPPAGATITTVTIPTSTVTSTTS